MYILAVLLLAFILDCIIGDPSCIPHPVVMIGKSIAKGEDILRRILKEKEQLAGTILAIFIILASFFITASLLFLLNSINFYLKFLIEVFICSQLLATKSLGQAGMNVFNALAENDIEKSRKAMSMIVGRDTTKLSTKQIINATIETVSENTSDGITAPLFFIILGGVPLGMAYKAINTLDSMIGYKNERYINFGRFAAIFDDVANFIPARITGLLMCISAFFLKLDYKNAYRIFKRDRKNHKSPNSAHLESACAGALGISLGGPSSYFGTIVDKPYIGDNLKEVSENDILLSIKLMYVTSFLALALFCGLKLLFFIKG